MHDINVIGTLQLLAACEKRRPIQAIVIRGSAGIYGVRARTRRSSSPRRWRGSIPLRTRFQRDVGEIENYFETYSRRHPGVICTMLRYQPAIGPSVDTQVTRYLSLPVVPTYLGFDPRLQFVHEEDALERWSAAVRDPVRGAVNVAGPGTIGLDADDPAWRGRPTLPVAGPLFGTVTDVHAAARAGRRCRRTSGGCCATAARWTSRAWSRRWASPRATRPRRRSRTTCAAGPRGRRRAAA